MKKATKILIILGAVLFVLVEAAGAEHSPAGHPG